jgi:hypothetical protein
MSTKIQIDTELERLEERAVMTSLLELLPMAMLLAVAARSSDRVVDSLIDA